MSQRAAVVSRSDSVAITFSRRPFRAPLVSACAQLPSMRARDRGLAVWYLMPSRPAIARSPEFLDVVQPEYAVNPLRKITEHHVVQKPQLTLEISLVFRIEEHAERARGASLRAKLSSAFELMRRRSYRRRIFGSFATSFSIFDVAERVRSLAANRVPS